jgi:hypothetical protein
VGTPARKTLLSLKYGVGRQARVVANARRDRSPLRALVYDEEDCVAVNRDDPIRKATRVQGYRPLLLAGSLALACSTPRRLSDMRVPCRRVSSVQ